VAVLMEKKTEIRNDMQKILSSMDERWVSAASREVCTNLNTILETDLKDRIKCILAWTKFFPGEADLSSFIVSQLGKREVFLPRSLPDRSMTFIGIGKDWNLEAETGIYGIPEPKDGAGSTYNLEQASETLVIVPGMAFDKTGNRLGRGKGYYDRFLSQLEMASSAKVGVCWTIQMVERVPVSSHDVAMDWICNEENIISVNKN